MPSTINDSRKIVRAGLNQSVAAPPTASPERQTGCRIFFQVTATRDAMNRPALGALLFHLLALPTFL